jgi:GH24 family phage-related lysozyme (muramidase)
MSPALEAQVRTRIAINEGRSAVVYTDSRGNPSIGIGYNLNTDATTGYLARIGADYNAVLGGAALTDAQIAALFDLCLAPLEGQVRALLAPNHYDNGLNDERKYVLLDMAFNMGTGTDGLGGFTNTLWFIDQACHQLLAGDGSRPFAHDLFGQAADGMAASAWAGQVGVRAARDIAIMRLSTWVDPNGNGSY